MRFHKTIDRLNSLYVIDLIHYGRCIGSTLTIDTYYFILVRISRISANYIFHNLQVLRRSSLCNSSLLP